MTVLYLLEAIGLWAMVHTTFASKLAATWNAIFLLRKSFSTRGLYVDLYVSCSMYFSLPVLLFFLFLVYSYSWQGKNTP